MSRYFPERLVRLAGPTPLVRRLSSQSVLSAFGDGVFLTGSAVFFTQIVGLSAAQVGLGLTIAGVVTFGLAVPLGKLSDRFGAKGSGRRLGARGRALPRLAGGRRDGGVHRDDDRPRAGQHDQPVGAQRVPVRHVPPRGTGLVQRVLPGRAQRRLHPGRAAGGHRAGDQRRRRDPAGPGHHRRAAAAQRVAGVAAPAAGAHVEHEAPLEAMVHEGTGRARCGTAATC